jgi:hypothetical protein
LLLQRNEERKNRIEALKGEKIEYFVLICKNQKTKRNERCKTEKIENKPSGTKDFK